MLFYICTLGCKVNQYESQELREELIRNAYSPVDSPEKADIIIVNSCTVTAESVRKVRQSLRHLHSLNPSAVLVLTGCASQANPEEFETMDEINVILGNRSNGELLKGIDEYLHTARRVVDVSPHMTGDAYRGTGITSFAEHTRAFLKIQDGCDRFCSYCLIPTARGRSRSKKPEEVKNELNALAASGYREIVFVGINLSDYGKGSDYSLPDAVELAESTRGIERIRLGSLEPDHITDSILSRLADCKKFCPQFHISLQSGCDKTLKAMNRHYDTAFYSDLCGSIRSLFPDATLTTDIMTGFPGETEEDFSETLGFVQKIRFEKVHVFPYSVRKGTRAAQMPQLTNAVKAERAKHLTCLADGIRREFLASQTGKTVCVLFENRGSGYSEGYTPNYINVRVTDDVAPGEIKQVLLTGADADGAFGKIL